MISSRFSYLTANLMLIRVLSLFISFLLLFNSIAIDLVLNFAPTKSEVLIQFRENNNSQNLEFACQFHNCGCTKETCKISCCCKTNHEVFNEIKKNQEPSCHEDTSCNMNSNVEIKAKPINIIQKMICKQDQIKKQDKLVLKREPFLLVKGKLITVSLRNQAIFSIDSFAYQGIATQTYYIPESPPPNISFLV